jgi:hypothetical protein
MNKEPTIEQKVVAKCVKYSNSIIEAIKKLCMNKNISSIFKTKFDP